MADEHGNESEVFEVDRIRNLIKLMDEFELSEIDLRHTDRRIRLRKGSDVQPVFQAMPQMPAAQAPAVAPAASPASRRIQRPRVQVNQKMTAISNTLSARWSERSIPNRNRMRTIS